MLSVFFYLPLVEDTIACKMYVPIGLSVELDNRNEIFLILVLEFWKQASAEMTIKKLKLKYY